MLLNLKFIPEIIQKVCVCVCLFVYQLVIDSLFYISLLDPTFFSKGKVVNSFSNQRRKFMQCSPMVGQRWANVGPTLNCQQTTDEKLLRNCYLSTMMAQRWPNVLYPTPTFADRTNQFPTLGQRMSAIWGQTDRQTEGQTDAQHKNNIYPMYTGGDIISMNEIIM